jgi:hypothetical protein
MPVLQRDVPPQIPPLIVINRDVGNRRETNEVIDQQPPDPQYDEPPRNCPDDAILNEEQTSSDDSSENDDLAIIPELVRWSHQHNISHAALTDLLKSLRRNVAGLRDLPCTARTLLQAKHHIDSIQISGRNFYHLGLQRQLVRLAENWADYFPDVQIVTMTISLNTDGLPLFKSSKQTVWPLLCNVMDVPIPVVLPITITCGNSKPTDTEYLNEGISEVITGVTDGFNLPDGRILKLRLKHIVLDAQARSLVKRTVQVGGYYACDRCDQRGEWIERKVTYPNSMANLRTDESFRSMAQPEHHRGQAAFLGLNSLDMIHGFPICSMHQVYLGVFRRLINIWKSGPQGQRIQGQNYIECNRIIRAASKKFTVDFPRKPRDFEESAHLKATELRDLMFYCCPIALKQTMDPDMYEHFLCLCIGIGLLSMDPLPGDELIGYAHRLLVRFVEDAKLIYGPGFIVYNVHSLVSNIFKQKYFLQSYIRAGVLATYFVLIKKEMKIPVKVRLLRCYSRAFGHSSLTSGENSDSDFSPDEGAVLRKLSRVKSQ